MTTKIIRISIVLLSLLALATPVSAKSLANETPPAGAFVSTEVNPASLLVGETTSVAVKLNNVPVEGYKSAEFTCSYDGTLVEKSNIAVTDLFGTEPVTVIHDPQPGIFIVAIAGMNTNRAVTGGTAFTFSAKGLQAGQSTVQCTARVSQGDNLAVDIPSVGTTLTVGQTAASPTATMDEHPTPIGTEPGSPTELPAGSLSGQLLASKPVTVRLLDANQAEIASVVADEEGNFGMTPPPGNYTLVATASGYLSYQGTFTVTDGNETVFPPETMLAGDVDGNNVIDQFDALTIGMSYTSSTPESADLNA
ncbi:MAG: carboxypeptidase regulatory-like domain-containing protein [Anaerolineales bacterium]